MKEIQVFVDHIKDELEDAKSYTEMYIDARINNQADIANKYKEMAEDELKHAGYLHQIATAKITAFKRYFEPTQEMVDTWNELHDSMQECSAWVRKMLSA